MGITWRDRNRENSSNVGGAGGLNGFRMLNTGTTRLPNFRNHIASIPIGVLISKVLKNPVVDPNLERCCLYALGFGLPLLLSKLPFPSSNPEQTTPQPL
jgi:hypothetical protein